MEDGKEKRQVCTLPGGEFLWMLLSHVLPRRFRRVRDFGLLHANAKRLIQLLQLTRPMRVPRPDPSPTGPGVLCERCGELMKIQARMVELSQHMVAKSESEQECGFASILFNPTVIG